MSQDSFDPEQVRQPDAAPCNATVLLIDDETVFHEIVRRTLEPHGYAVLTAPDGLAGVQIAEREDLTVDIILLDLVMPGLSGKEALPRLRGAQPRAKIILFTGYLPPDHDAAEDGSKPDGHLVKPVAPRELLRYLDAHLG